MGIRVTVVLDEADLREAVCSTNTDAVREMIRGLDLAVQEVDFTESVIKMLAQSISGDMDAEDYASLIHDLASYKPSR